MNSFFSLSNGLVNPIHDLLLLIIIFLVVEFPFSFFVVPSPLLKFSILSFNMVNIVTLKSVSYNSNIWSPCGVVSIVCCFCWFSFMLYALLRVNGPLYLQNTRQKFVYSSNLRPKISFFRKDLSLLLPGSWESLAFQNYFIPVSRIEMI